MILILATLQPGIDEPRHRVVEQLVQLLLDPVGLCVRERHIASALAERGSRRRLGGHLRWAKTRNTS